MRSKKGYSIQGVKNMKIIKILCFAFVLIFAYVGFNACQSKPVNSFKNLDEVRAMWFSYIEYSSILQDASESEFTESINEVFQNCVDNNINTIYIHAVAFTDTFYPSQYLPYSQYAKDSQGNDPTYDPFAIVVKIAKKHNLRVEAWINPMRSLKTEQLEELDKSTVVGKWYHGEQTQGTYIVQQEGRGYLNPAYPEVRKLIVNVAQEIIRNYEIAGIHMDDYFYPEGIKAEFDDLAYSDYKEKGGSLKLADFRRMNTSSMVQELYAAIKKVDSKLTFGISPAGNIQYSIEEIYADVETWVKNEGYIDYIAPQIYFGFTHEILPFNKNIQQWEDLVSNKNVEIIYGLAAYKINTVDNYAGLGKYEWSVNNDILARQVVEARKMSKYKGFSIFSYNSLFKPSSENEELAKKQLDNLEKLLK